MRCLLYLLKCCCGPKGCSIICIGPLRESSTTRIMYSIMLILVSIVQTLSHDHKIIPGIAKKLTSTFNSTCLYIRAGPNCERLTGYKAIYRIAYAFFVFHLTMALLCVCIENAQGFRARIHNGFWFLKILVILALWAILYLIPIFEDIIFIATIIGLMAAFIFVIIQQVSLIDCAYELNGYLRTKGSANCCFTVFIYIISLILYVATAIAYTLIYFQFAIPNYCNINRVVIIVNAAASLTLVTLSFCVNKYNKCKLYIPGGVTCLFVAFLTWTAISSAPDYMNSTKQFVTYSNVSNDTTDTVLSCKRQNGFYTTYISEDLHAYLGITIMLFTAAYSSIKSTADGKRYGLKSSRSKMMLQSQSNFVHEKIEIQELKGKSKPPMSGTDGLAPISEIGENGQMPNADMENSISETKLEQQNSESLENGLKGSDSMFSKGMIIENKAQSIGKVDTKCSKVNLKEDLLQCDEYLIHDEYNAVQYSYSWLHFVFALAYLFVMVQLTDWYSPETSNIHKFSGTWPSMWMKIVTSWVALSLFGWTILCPAFCIGRKLYEYPIDSLNRFRQRSIKSKK